GNTERLRGSKPNADEHGIEPFFDPFDADLRADLGVLPELDSGRLHEIGLAPAVGWTEFILGDAVGIQTAGHRALVEDGHGESAAAKLDGAGKRRRSTPDAGYFAGPIFACRESR